MTPSKSDRMCGEEEIKSFPVFKAIEGDRFGSLILFEINKKSCLVIFILSKRCEICTFYIFLCILHLK